MTVTSGLRCCESSENSGPLGCLVKMCLESSIWHSTRCLLTWKRKVTPARHSIFQLAVSMPHTEDSGSQFWPTVTTDTASARTKRYKQGWMPLAAMLQMYPTPTTGAGLCGGTGNFKTLQRLQEIGKITEEERRQLSQGNGGKANPDFLEWLMGYEQKFTTLIPTPRASDANGAALDSWYSQTVQVERERAGQVPRQTERACASHSAWEAWPDEPGVGRVADGVPNRVDRIRCLGNAVVPQQFYPFFEAIAKIERSKET